jgi:hypothetical protein
LLHAQDVVFKEVEEFIAQRAASKAPSKVSE